MRKATLLFASLALLATTASAQSFTLGNQPGTNHQVAITDGELQQALPEVGAQQTGIKRAKSDPIMKTPDGDLMTYSLYTWMLGTSGGEGYWRDGVKTQVVKNDNKIYIQNMATAYSYGGWLVGTLNDAGDLIEFANPQPYYQDKDGYTYYVGLCTVDEDGSVWADNDTKQFYMSYDAETGRIWNDSIEICLSNEDGGVFSYNYSYEYTVFNDTLVTPPADWHQQPYACYYETNNKWDYPIMVYVASDGKDFYFKGFSEYSPEGWIKGTLQGDSVVCDNFQYVGMYKDTYFLYAKGAYLTGLDEYGYGIFKSKDDIKFAYNPDDFSLISPNGILICLGNKKSSSYCSSITSQEMYPFYQKVATPATPEPTSWTDFEDYDMGYSMGYYIPVEDVDGNYINPDSLYYRIWVDDTIFTFHKPWFQYIDEGTQVLPSKWDDGNRISGLGTYHNIWIEEKCNTIGFQSIYIIDGYARYSDIATYHVETGEITYTASGINDVMSDSANRQVVAVRYYDLTGRLLSQPADGITIRQTIYSDGTSSSVKLMK